MARTAGLFILAIFVSGLLYGSPAAIVKPKEETSSTLELKNRAANVSVAASNETTFSYSALLKSIEDDEEAEKTQLLLSRIKRAGKKNTPLKILKLLLKKIKNKRLRRKIIELIKRKLKQRRIKTRNRNKIFRLIQLLINALRPGSFGGFDYLLSSSYYDYSSFGSDFSSDELYNIDYGSWRYLQTFIERPEVNTVFADVVNDIDTITANSDNSIDVSVLIPDLTSLGSSDFFAEAASYDGSTSLSGFDGIVDPASEDSLLSSISDILSDETDPITSPPSSYSIGSGSTSVQPSAGAGSTSGGSVSSLPGPTDSISAPGSISGISGSVPGTGSIGSISGSVPGTGSIGGLPGSLGSIGVPSLPDSIFGPGGSTGDLLDGLFGSASVSNGASTLPGGSFPTPSLPGSNSLPAGSSLGSLLDALSGSNSIASGPSIDFAGPQISLDFGASAGSGLLGPSSLSLFDSAAAGSSPDQGGSTSVGSALYFLSDSGSGSGSDDSISSSPSSASASEEAADSSDSLST